MSSTYAAVLVAGHMRTFEQCRDNLHKNIVTPLQELGYTVNIFIATWGSNNIDTGLERARVAADPDQRDNVLRAFGVSSWHSKYSMWTTSGDAASMWNRVEAAYNNMLRHEMEHGHKHELIVRTRPDMWLHAPLCSTMLKQAVQSPNVFMAEWGGCAEDVTYRMMDHIAFGGEKAMRCYCSTFSSIPRRDRQDSDRWFTAEGHLCTNLEHCGVSIERVPGLRYALLRETGKLDEMIKDAQ